MDRYREPMSIAYACIEIMEKIREREMRKPAEEREEIEHRERVRERREREWIEQSVRRTEEKILSFAGVEPEPLVGWSDWTRWVFTVALLVMVWLEAGPWTSLVLTLVAINVECQGLLRKWDRHG